MPIAQHEESGFFIVELEQQRVQVPRYCPHRGGRLDHGHINTARKTLSCPLHRSVFSLEDGRQLSGPPCGDLPVRPCASVQTPLADSLDQN
ncbi:MAG: (2Fe-2S)-binding protein [Pseudomonadales bacterium]|jgi:type I protein arginine methyltransferase|uniref:Rieske (2Fe-2S) protein n=1 Tax=unclassified Ketobacter TaxID=2639109 RepID=UPI000C5E97D7|nr:MULTISPECIES: Rieske (2Fe-2S) protein [unclassified Ketobacter]MAA60018.1 (2Fe-2S)-binding protein [Pseudomonadales bacterium]MEC8812635.1 Rieske (2Fe-2S) protein [Pseudomonadota bacterium]TNC85232.1 MAG: (2Fe-2S)-binding protein [Alcanivorax sp.]HAG96051.1 (2Fe-2S)-binding protein [Gammaproteobacteria bacterium]MAQ25185.1 (2Fe-2S)-binding protein [Pseudomonadales bacterium]|tara:strand:+ start:2005 stop:2277 length:273 start_codon:yes stop_codon:yes gene_type:complete